MRRGLAGLLSGVRLVLVLALAILTGVAVRFAVQEIASPGSVSRAIVVPGMLLLVAAIGLMLALALDDTYLNGYLQRRGWLGRLHIALWVAGFGALALGVAGGHDFSVAVVGLLLPAAVCWVIFSALSRTFLTPREGGGGGAGAAGRGAAKRAPRGGRKRH
jgi:hypothetical protein